MPLNHFAARHFGAGHFISLYGLGDVPPVVDTPTRGGINPQDVKRYMEFIDSLKRLDAKKDITPQIVEAAQAIEALPVEAVQIETIASAVDYTPQIDFDALALEIASIQAYIDRMEKYYYDYMAEQDDEIAFLLLVN